MVTELRAPPPPPVDYHAKWAVIIGIDDYSRGKGLDNLRYAANDAREFRRVLVEEFGYDDEHVLYLTDAGGEPGTIVDSRPTRSAIRSAFETWLPGQRPQPDDSVLVFFAGHGERDTATRRGYLAAADSNASCLQDSCIGFDWIVDRLGALDCRHKLVLLDCCFSGSIFELQPLQVGASRPAAELGPVLAGRAFLAMTAGLGTQPVLDGTGKDQHSYFTKALLGELRDRANTLRADHSFLFGTLGPRVKERVEKETRQVPLHGRIVPGEGDFLFRPTVWRPTPVRRELSLGYARAIAEVQATFARGDVERAVRLLREKVPEPGQDDLRGFEWHYYWRLLARSNLATLQASPQPKVNALAVGTSPDGAILASNHGPRIRLWDLAKRRELSQLVGHPKEVMALAITKDGRTLASAGWDGTIKVWEPARGVVLGTFRGGGRPLISADFSSDGRSFAVSGGAGIAGELIVFRATDGWERVESVATAYPVYSVAFDPGELVLAYCGGITDRSGEIRMRRLDDGQDEVFADSRTAVVALAFSPDGRMLAAGDFNGVVRVYNRKSRELIHHLRGHDKVHSLAFSPDGRVLMSTGGRPPSPGELCLWDAKTGTLMSTLRAPESSILCARFSPDGSVLATGEGAGGLRLLDVAEASVRVVLSYPEEVSCLAFSPDGRTLAVGCREGLICLSDVATRRLTRQIPGHHGKVRSLAFSPDGRQLASGGEDGTSRLWDAGSGESRSTFRGRPKWITSVAFTPDGSSLLAGGGCHNDYGEVHVWDSATGDDRGPLCTFGKLVSHIAPSPDGSTLAVALDGENGEGDHQVSLRALARGEETRRVEGHGPIAMVRIRDPIPTNLIVTSRVNALRVAISSIDAELANFVVHSQFVDELIMSPGGRTLATIGFDGAGYSSRLWDFVTGSPLMALDTGDEGDVRTLAISPEGRIVATSSLGKRVILWDSTYREE